MHASDGWIDKLAMFISQRCALWCWSAVFQRSRCRLRLPPVQRLPPGGDLLREQCRDFSWGLLHRRRERCLSDHRQFLSEPSSARYSSTPPLTTVWSNYQFPFNDCFEVYITKILTLLPNVQTDFRSVQLCWSIILCSDWSIASQLTYTVTMTISM